MKVFGKRRKKERKRRDRRKQHDHEQPQGPPGDSSSFVNSSGSQNSNYDNNINNINNINNNNDGDDDDDISTTISIISKQTYDSARKKYHEMKMSMNFEENASLQKGVPSQSPQMWIIINTICFLYSLVLSVYIVKALKVSGERPSAEASYLLWNFGTTLVWCLEAGLEAKWNYHQNPVLVVAQHQDDPETSSTPWSWWTAATSSFDSIANWMELLVAVYFSIDSAALVWKWQIKGHDVTERLLEVTLNLIFFLYAMIRDFIRLHGSTSTITSSNEEMKNRQQYMQIV